MSRRGRSGASADPGLAGTDGTRRGRATRVPAGRTVFIAGVVCLILGVLVARLVILMAEARPEFGRAWLPAIATGCAVSVSWAGLWAAAIWRYRDRRWVQWIGYAYAFATVVLMAPFFPRSPGTGFSFTSKLHRGSPPPLVDWLMLRAMAFVATGITITALAVLLHRPLSRLDSRIAADASSDVSSVLHVQARLRDVGPDGPGPWRRGELRLAPGSVTWSMSRGRALVDLTGARLEAAGFPPRTRGGRVRRVLVRAPAGLFELGVQPEVMQEFLMLADHFQPWRAQDTEPG